jgi:hypothetical protein
MQQHQIISVGPVHQARRIGGDRPLALGMSGG